jgi:hypothetical protein
MGIPARSTWTHQLKGNSMTKIQPVPTPDFTIPEQSENGSQPDEAQIDPYAPEQHTISGAMVSVEKMMLAVKIRKPRRDEFIRVHPDPDFVHDYVLLELEEGMDRVRYLVMPPVRHLIPIGLSPTRLFIAINTASETFVWPIRLPENIHSASRQWSQTALDCAEEAQHLWVRVAANKSAGYYEGYRALEDLGEPEWPKKSFRDLMELAFKGNVVDQPDHHVIRKLNGQQR